MDAQDRKETYDAETAHARAEKVLANSGATSAKFAEPQGWALKWDGAALPDDTEPEDGRSSSGTPSAC